MPEIPIGTQRSQTVNSSFIPSFQPIVRSFVRSVVHLFGLFICLNDLPFSPENADDPNLFEGDMILTRDQRMAAALGLDVDNPFGRAASGGRQWPGGVLVYAIHPSLGKSIPTAIKN